MLMRRTAIRLGSAVLLASLATAATATAGPSQSTELISRAAGGGTPDGASTNAVISGDRRFARLIAFQSEATNLVRGDTNRLTDVFAVKRSGSFGNNGSPWRGDDAVLLSAGLGGAPADGRSFGAAVSGDFRHPGSCVAFLSAATNLVAGDTNGHVDAFLVTSPGRAPRRVSPASMAADADGISVSGDCSQVSFTAGGRLYTSRSGAPGRAVRTKGSASEPSYAAGNSRALVYTARGGVYLSQNGLKGGKLVARGGRNPAFNDLKRRTVTYEKTVGGTSQIGYHDIGKGERIISAKGGSRGNANSRNPVIGNSGFYVTFESDASNLGLDAAGQTGDGNSRPDVYLFTDSRDITLVQSVE
ncbi:MAG: hypothetical protein QOJ12_1596, partial [Thermoleophilales bacterium]|nr:hypothetical protein [Thermoleophilales bacterium]